MPLYPDLDSDGHDVVFNFRLPRFYLPSSDLHLGAALYMSLISALTGWREKSQVGS